MTNDEQEAKIISSRAVDLSNKILDFITTELQTITDESQAAFVVINALAMASGCVIFKIVKDTDQKDLSVSFIIERLFEPMLNETVAVKMQNGENNAGI